MLEYYLINENDNLKIALDYLNKNPDKCLVVQDNKGRLLGTITDGDIRRSILKGLDFQSKIGKIYNKKPFFIKYKGKIDNINISKKILNNYSVIPLIDSNKKIINLLSKNLVSKKKQFKNKKIKFDIQFVPVVIMAGGEGKRLLPHTAIIPKPLLPYKGKSLAEHIISKFQDYGFYNFIFTIKYKSNLMKAYFSNLAKKTKINFVQELKSLGTAGSLKKLVKKKDKTYFVINCDSLINCDYISLLNFHKDNKNDVTLVISRKNQVFNYGSCIIKKNGTLKKIIEKPSTTHLANTGLYVMEKKTFNLIKKNEFLNMNQLIERLLKRKFKVGVYPINDDDWQDLGTWDKF